MSFTGSQRVPRTPTLPQGELVAAYGTYLEAQRAVDHLSDKQFPVQLVTIVGTELRMVERVTGRLSYSRVALAGFGSGAWFGLFVGLLLSTFSTAGAGLFLAAVVVGGAFGLLFSVITYSFTGGKRDFTSQSQIVATQYAVLCAAEKANDARGLLQEIGGVQGGWGRPATPVATVPPSDPRSAYPAPGTPTAPTASPTVPPVTPAQPPQAPQQPRYGQLAPQPPVTPGEPSGEQPPTAPR